MELKDCIMEIIENDPVTKETYENEAGSFKNVVVPQLALCDENNLVSTMIFLLAAQSKVYDVVLDNISLLGSQELIMKCKKDISAVFSYYPQE